MLRRYFALFIDWDQNAKNPRIILRFAFSRISLSARSAGEWGRCCAWQARNPQTSASEPSATSDEAVSTKPVLEADRRISLFFFLEGVVEATEQAETFGERIFLAQLRCRTTPRRRSPGCQPFRRRVEADAPVVRVEAIPSSAPISCQRSPSSTVSSAYTATVFAYVSAARR